MGFEDQEGTGSSRDGGEAPRGEDRQPESANLPDATRWLEAPQSPVYHAEHAERYERQALIRAYQVRYDCRLIVMIDEIFWWCVTYFEELLQGASPDQDLHLILDTPGGDGEVAIQLARAAQSRCRNLVVIVPNQAKSAGTVLALAADEILMGPTSDLGPIDPQFQIPGKGGLVAAKDIVSAVDDGIDKVQAAPDTYPLVASLLSDVDLVMYQQAQSALQHTSRLLSTAISANPHRTTEEIKELFQRMEGPLVEDPKHHGAVFGLVEAQTAGLPARHLEPDSDQWRIVWRLWTKYFVLRSRARSGFLRIYEGEYASQIIDPV